MPQGANSVEYVISLILHVFDLFTPARQTMPQISKAGLAHGDKKKVTSHELFLLAPHMAVMKHWYPNLGEVCSVSFRIDSIDACHPCGSSCLVRSED